MSGKGRRSVLWCALACVPVVIATLVWRDPGGVPAPQSSPQAGQALPGPRLSADPSHRPVVAVIAHNANTELADFVVPYAVLKRAGGADVWALGLEPGPVRFFPALRARPDADIAAFDQRYPDGADYVIVPAVHDDDDPRLLAWVAGQARKGAVVIGICDGVWVLARAGLLEGREAVSHWYSRGALADGFPGVRWRQDRRYVADGNVVTTTGVSASIPVSLALVQALAGPSRAQSLARELGEGDWGGLHPGEGFRLGPRHLYTAAANAVAFWRHETLVARLAPGADDLYLALAADAFARSYRTSIVGRTGDAGPVTLASGLVYLPDDGADAGEASLPWLAEKPVAEGEPRAALARMLDLLQDRYGQATADFVALQLEYPRPKR
ncbi:transcriptional regulator [Achromobacter xylosoxidans]|nr:DJ-1/PfpI family protein [Achromobacter ruhlandii]OCZ77895.1 transcriptional regulator [Achromobacter xylosoxidans]